LDGAAVTHENADMMDTGDVGDHRLQMLVLERRDPSRNMARFYMLAIEPSLFGDMALVREWGRVGSLGRRRLDLHPNVTSAGEALDMWLARKARRGYQVRASRSPS
jgi:predicted DNA-binding WGR domain protein